MGNVKMNRVMMWFGVMAASALAGIVPSAIPGIAAGASSVPQEIQADFDKHEYQHVLERIAGLDAQASGTPNVQRLKIRALVKLNNPKEALVEYGKLEVALKQEDQTVLQEVALGFILVMVKDMREQMRGAAYTALKEIDPDEAAPYFEDGLSDASGPVRMLAVEGLSRSEKGRTSKRLRAAMDDQAALVKARVVKAIARTGDPDVVALVESAAKDDLSAVRVAAYGALIRLGKKEVWNDLLQAARSPNPEDRADAIRVIAELKDQRGASVMMEALTSKQPSVRAAAARGLGHLGRTEAREAIEPLLKDPVPGVRESAVGGLADLGGSESVEAIKRAMGDGNFAVRASAIAALLHLGQPYSIVASAAQSLARQNDMGMRASVAYALGKATKVNAPGAISLLAGLTGDPLPGPKIVALRSLGHVGDRNLVPLLKDALHDANDAVRATAAGALLHLLQQKK